MPENATTGPAPLWQRPATWPGRTLGAAPIKRVLAFPAGVAAKLREGPAGEGNCGSGAAPDRPPTTMACPTRGVQERITAVQNLAELHQIPGLAVLAEQVLVGLRVAGELPGGVVPRDLASGPGDAEANKD